MAAIRLDDKADNIENKLSLALADSANNGVTNKSITSLDPLASSTWEEVTFVASQTLFRGIKFINFFFLFEKKICHHLFGQCNRYLCFGILL